VILENFNIDRTCSRKYNAVVRIRGTLCRSSRRLQTIVAHLNLARPLKAKLRICDDYPLRSLRPRHPALLGLQIKLLTKTPKICFITLKNLPSAPRVRNSTTRLLAARSDFTQRPFDLPDHWSLTPPPGTRMHLEQPICSPSS